jgi:hypothetical protein
VVLGKSWKVFRRTIFDMSPCLSSYKLTEPVEEAMAKMEGLKGEKWRSRIAEGWEAVWQSCLLQLV